MQPRFHRRQLCLCWHLIEFSSRVGRGRSYDQNTADVDVKKKQNPPLIGRSVTGCRAARRGRPRRGVACVSQTLTRIWSIALGREWGWLLPRLVLLQGLALAPKGCCHRFVYSGPAAEGIRTRAAKWRMEFGVPWWNPSHVPWTPHTEPTLRAKGQQWQSGIGFVFNGVFTPVRACNLRSTACRGQRPLDPWLHATHRWAN